MKNKGFTLIELLAVITILGILAGIGVPAVTKHLRKARNSSYEHMLTGAYDAANNKILAENIICTAGARNSCKFTLKELMEEEYLETLLDPTQEGKACDGAIVVEPLIDSGKLDDYKYECYLKCSGYEETRKWLVPDTETLKAEEYFNSSLNEE